MVTDDNNKTYLNEDEAKKLYNALIGKGYSEDNIGDEQTFYQHMSDRNDRRLLYDWVESRGDFGIGDYEKYESRLTSPAVSADDAARLKAQSGATAKAAQKTVGQAEEKLERTEKQYGSNRLDYDKTQKGDMQLNPSTGKLEQTYLTPAGNAYTDKGLADRESFRYRQAVADMTVSGQLRKAGKRLEELKARLAETEGDAAAGKIRRPAGDTLGMTDALPEADRRNSPEARALRVAIHQTEEQIKTLKEQDDRENGDAPGFWRGFGRTFLDPRSWDFGIGGAVDAYTMANADKLTGENATEGERQAYDAMMGSIQERQETDAQYGDNGGFLYRAGLMTGAMPAFMVDFGVSYGTGIGAFNAIGKGAAKLATKTAGKEAVKQMAEQGIKTYVKNNGLKGATQAAANFTIKALGTTADELLVRAPLMANTVQAGKTASDIVERKLGNVVEDENGKLKFENDKTWGQAAWQGEANMVIEDYSEMFGAHLDPVLSLKNVNRLADAIGAKRLGSVLAKSDAKTLGGIMDTTGKLFEKMGVSDYLGEVSEEYYGQLWRTMLNLDDAYIQNPDGTRTNLLESQQFHGDVLGGMALSMGMMGAAKGGITAARYASIKHGVNKADALASNLLGIETWEPLRQIIDSTANEDTGELINRVIKDNGLTKDEKSAVLSYMEHSMNMRGFNLADLAQKRSDTQDPDKEEMNESWLDGYAATSPEEMNDAKNLFLYHRADIEQLVNGYGVEMMDNDPVGFLQSMREGLWDEESKARALDYINAKQVWDGMIQRVRDDIDGRIAQSDAMVDLRTHKETGLIHGATMKVDDRKVYVVGGRLVLFPDGKGVDKSSSSPNIIIRDAETGKIEMVAPEAILSIDDPLDPVIEKETAAQAIRMQFGQQEADKIDGTVKFNPGDVISVPKEDGTQVQATVVSDNGDGTLSVTEDGQHAYPVSKEPYQAQADQANQQRVVDFENQRKLENQQWRQQAEQDAAPTYQINDELTLRDDEGSPVNGRVVSGEDADRKILVETESPINGKTVQLFTAEEIAGLQYQQPQQVSTIEQPATEQQAAAVEPAPVGEPAPTEVPEQPASRTAPATAMERIPVDEQGQPMYTQADPETAWDAFVEQAEGDEDMAQEVADGMVATAEQELKKIEKQKPKAGSTPAEMFAAAKERKAAVENAKKQVDAWKAIAGTRQRRIKAAADEAEKIAKAKAAEAKAEEERLKAEREEAERKEKEALNGVPDMLHDKPKDARARGYRRVNGHKVDRQEPLEAKKGKEISVKFSEGVIKDGTVSLIEADQLQPSHIQGARNPMHFIDEAQPKERNDEASVLSSRKIASNIRPEEITSSVTAFTGAPTVNTRGEAIQGNNRSDALRQMWEGQPEQAQKYKSYLVEHAADFGLNPEDVENMNRPVLVSMLDVSDDEAIELGQYVAQDTESGGVERIKAKNLLGKMGGDMSSFTRILLKTADDETSLAELLEANGVDVLKWMNTKGYITPTQYNSSFDGKGYLSAEAKEDLKGVLYQSIFRDGSTSLKGMFDILPSKAQKAILATAWRDHDNPESERMTSELQNSFSAYHAVSSASEEFKNAKSYEDAINALEDWKRQSKFDDSTGETYFPAKNYSNFALLLAAMYKGQKQGFIQSTFNRMYDLIQGTQQEILFESPDNTPRTLAEAIKETLNIDYNGQNGSDILAGDSAASQRGERGSSTNTQPDERVEEGEQPADSGTGAGAVRAGTGEQAEVENIGELPEERPQQQDSTTTEATVKQEAGAKADNEKPVQEPKKETSSGYTIEKRFNEKRQKNIWAVKFEDRVERPEFLNQKAKAKELGGYWSNFGKKGFIFNSEEDAEKFAEAVMVGKSNPITLEDLRGVSQEENVKEETKAEEKPEQEQKEVSKTAEQPESAPEEQQGIAGNDKGTAREQQPKPVNQSGNKLVTDERYEELKRRMREKLKGQMNMGIDPEILAIGTEMALYHLEKGTRKFVEYAKAMIADLGDAVRPYLKAFYNGARDLPEVAGTEIEKGMTSYEEVRSIDVANFDKQTVDAAATAETVAREQEVEDEAEQAKEKIREVKKPKPFKERSLEGMSDEEIEEYGKTVTRDGVIDALEAKKEEGQRVEILENKLGLIDGTADYWAEVFLRAGRHYFDYVDGYVYRFDLDGQVREIRYIKNKETNGTAAEFNKDGSLKKVHHYKDGALRSDTEKKKTEPTVLEEGNEEIKAASPGSATEVKNNRTSGYVAQQKLFEEFENQVDAVDMDINAPLPKEGLKQDDGVIVKQKGKGKVQAAFVGDDLYLRYDSDKTAIRIAGAKKLPANVVVSALETSAGESLPVVSDAINQLYRESGLGTSLVVPVLRDLTREVPSEKSENVSTKEKKAVSSQKKPEEKGLSETNESTNKKKNDNGLQGIHEQRTEGLPADRSGQSEGLREGTQGSSQRAGQESGRSDSEGKGQGIRQTGSVSSGLLERKNLRNNRSERGEDHAPKSVDARIEANIKAIELSKQLLENDEQATPEQMQVLRKYSGWGGLGKAFQSYSSTESRLRELLGETAYEQAVMSRNSAYYTPAYISDTLWDIAEKMGFKGGTVLEGSAGIGNILGQMPQALSEKSDIHAVEIDGTTGGMLSLLYPDAKVDIQGFENTKIPNGSVDLAITNVPFVTGLHVLDTTGDKDLSTKFKDIHDFCIAKNVRKLREGGIGIFISSNGTLDKSKKLRDWVVNEGDSDFMGTFRLNNKTFGEAAVTSDIIVIRKRINGRKWPDAIDVSATAVERNAEYVHTEYEGRKYIEHKDVLPMEYNRYFIEHPEMMAGKMRFGFEDGNSYRATSKSLVPVAGMEQKALLEEFVSSLREGKPLEENEKRKNAYVEDRSAGGRKVGEMYVKDGKFVTATVGGYAPLDINDNKIKGHTKLECFNDYSGLKKALDDVLLYQAENESDEGLKPLLEKLNKLYDGFVDKYGHFHKNNQLSFLRNDLDYANIFALEDYTETNDKDNKRVPVFSKTDVFKKRVVIKSVEPHPANVKDGIIASMFKFGRVDVPYIAEQLSTDEDAVSSEILVDGLGYEDPVSRRIEVSYVYLSGNVKEKLRQAQENNEDGRYDKNIKALQGVIPMDIPAHLIDFTLGSSWVQPKIYEDFVKEKTDVPVKLMSVDGTWYMEPQTYYTNTAKNRELAVESKVCDKIIWGHSLIEAAMQNRSVSVSKTVKDIDGRAETIYDKEATQACMDKINDFRLEFKDWARAKMQSDPAVSKEIERKYNDGFNNYVPTKIPDEFLPERFPGATDKFVMRPHQSKAIVRSTMQPLMLAHEVGTGKTFTLISIAMEMRRLGTAKKPMIVVQNATVGQFVSSAKALYPNAKVLSLEDNDRGEAGRKNFYAKIRYNDWDMIVVPQSTLEFIPDSKERQAAFIQDKIDEKMMVLEQMREQKEGNTAGLIIKQAEREIKKLEDEKALIMQGGPAKTASKKKKKGDEKLSAKTRQNTAVQAQEMLDRRVDEVRDFDEMGVDALLVDEAHEYKHLGFATVMQRGVKGVDPSYSKKSQGVFLKVQSVLEKSGGKNVVFATGTPISNTAAEIWTFMRYLMPADTMKEYGIYYFDDFVRNFGNIQQMMEHTVSGFKENNRFAGYVNIPELVRIWSGVSDTVLTEEAADVKDKIPDMEEGRAQDIYLPQTKALRAVMKYAKEELNKYDKMSGKEKKQNSHIPLVMYGLAKAAAVDARLVMPDAADEPNSKTNEAVRQTLRSLREADSYKGTVAIFADNYQNKKSGFNLYEDIRKKLIDNGVPAERIVVMKSGMSVKKKLDIFDRVNSGEIRVIMGSTYTLGTGVNIQERLHTLIHVDAPNRPMDYTQRNGRILRQGNLHKGMGKPVRVLRFGVEDSLDVTAYQRLKTKGAIADSIMRGKRMMENSMVNRVLEEEEDVFGDTVAQLSGSQYALLKNNAEKNLRKYRSRKKQWEADQIYVHNAIPRLEGQIRKYQGQAVKAREYLNAVKAAFKDGQFSEIKTGKNAFKSVEDMADFFKEHNKGVLDTMAQMKKDGGVKADNQQRSLTLSLNGFDFAVKTVITKGFNRNGTSLFPEVHRDMTYSCPELGLENVPVKQSLLRNAVEDIVQNVITGNDFAERLEAAERGEERTKAELDQVRTREGRSFEFEKELKQSEEQLEDYTEKMKKELDEKEAKYAKMDAEIEEAHDVSLDEGDDDTLYRSDDTMYRIREDAPPKRTGTGYKVFVLKDGELYPPMVANPGGEATPLGVWLDADAAPIAGQTKTGRAQVKAGGRGTQGGGGKLAYRPGWHLGEMPYATQFNRQDENGNKSLFPSNFVWAEVEYADDADYQDEAMSYGYTDSGKFRHSYAGLPRVPENGSYRYRTNPNPDTDEWIITGAMRVNRILKPSEVDELVKAAGREPQKRQEKSFTDADIDALNEEIERNTDGWSYAGSRTKKERVKPERRPSNKKMAEGVKQLAKELNLDNVDVLTDTGSLEGKKAKSKGFYTKSTGRITVVIPNHADITDAQKTLLHEAVAHYGLRKLFGANFDTFLDNVYDNAEEGIRRAIETNAEKKHKGDIHAATEEYLASLAEGTDFKKIKPSFWKMIKNFFLNMLHRIGFKDFGGVTLSDNELRYILWRSYKNLEEPDSQRSVFGMAEDISRQYELGVGDYSENTLYRDGDPEMRERKLARDAYESRVRSGMYQAREAAQDSMLSLKEAMKVVLGKQWKGVDEVEGFENPYQGENRLSSQNLAEVKAFERTLFKPLLDTVASLAKNEDERRELTDYMMAKHGLERNRVMAERNAKKNEDVAEIDRLRQSLEKRHDSGKLDDDDYADAMAKADSDYEKAYETALAAAERDYAGLTALTGLEELAEAEAEATRMVEDYEDDHDTTGLWDRVNAVTKATLSKVYESGMLTKEAYQDINGMYEYYIPLRGFDEKTSAEAYAYLTHKNSAFNAPIKKAEGRKSKSDDPLAYMRSMATSAIVQGNRNVLVKQRLLNFALNHPSDLFSVSELWIAYDATKDEWAPVFPDNIGEDDTPAEVESKMADFEKTMQELASLNPDLYKRGGDAVGIPYRVVEKRELQQHQVIVKRGGRDVVVTVNGSPRVAQAVNGLTNPDNDIEGSIGAMLRAGEWINRQLSALYTTRNPDFVISNFMRDALYSNSMAWIKESPNYALRFHRNFAVLNPLVMRKLFAKLREGKLDMSNEREAAFSAFIMNGGETGYTSMKDLDKIKREINAELKMARGKLKPKKAWEYLTERLDELNSAVENCARFAAFQTSRQMGRSLDRSIADAKEITVNFNKKGSGSKFYGKVGQTGIGETAAFISGGGRALYVFWNAAIQGTFNFGRQAAKHPAKALAAAASMFLLGALTAYLGSDDDDDRNAYYNLPEYLRRTNILFRVGDYWISIPLPVEYRAIYGMGELAASVTAGKEHKTGGEIAMEMAGQVSQLMPIDFLEGGGGAGNLIPSSVKPLAEAYVMNKSWTGMPIYKDSEWNKEMPEWTKAYKSANKYIVELSAVLNDLTGGDAYTKGAVDINPAKVEYLLNGVFGGVASTIDKLVKTGETVAGEREFDPRSFLLLNRVLRSGDERTEMRAINNEYWRLRKEHDTLKKRLNHYLNDTASGLFDYAEKIDFLYNSDEYARYEIYESFLPELNALEKTLKQAYDEQERAWLEQEMNELKRQMVELASSAR